MLFKNGDTVTSLTDNTEYSVKVKII